MKISRLRVAAFVACVAVGCSSGAPDSGEHVETSKAASSYIYPPLANGDRWGCDTDNQPLLKWVVDSSSNHGGCCDSHDWCMDNVSGCYGDFGQWWTAYNCKMGYQTAGCGDPCIQCHLGMMGCLAGPPTGESQCRIFDNCLDPRRAGNPFGCTNDTYCREIFGNPAAVCDNSNGNCVIQPVCFKSCGNGACECDEPYSCPGDCGPPPNPDPCPWCPNGCDEAGYCQPRVL